MHINYGVGGRMLEEGGAGQREIKGRKNGTTVIA